MTKQSKRKDKTTFMKSPLKKRSIRKLWRSKRRSAKDVVCGSEWTWQMLKEMKIDFQDITEATKFKNAINSIRSKMKKIPFQLRAEGSMPAGFGALPKELVSCLSELDTLDVPKEVRRILEDFYQMYYNPICEDTVNQFMVDLLRWFQPEKTKLWISVCGSASQKLYMGGGCTEAKADVAVSSKKESTLKLVVVEDKPRQNASQMDLLAQLTAEAIATAQGHNIAAAVPTDQHIWGILDVSQFMQIVYFHFPLSFLKGFERGVFSGIKFQRLLSVTGKGLDFANYSERSVMAEVIGGILDLLEKEV